MTFYVKKNHFIKLFCSCFVKLIFSVEFHSVPFRASELALPPNSECLGMRAFFRGITETIPSLFRGIFSEQNSVPNPIHSPHKLLYYSSTAFRLHEGGGGGGGNSTLLRRHGKTEVSGWLVAKRVLQNCKPIMVMI